LSFAAVHARSIWLFETAVAPRPPGAVGGWVSTPPPPPAPRNAAICITQPALPLLIDPVAL
jgi:hypothetical protein